MVELADRQLVTIEPREPIRAPSKPVIAGRSMFTVIEITLLRRSLRPAHRIATPLEHASKTAWSPRALEV